MAKKLTGKKKITKIDEPIKVDLFYGLPGTTTIIQCAAFMVPDGYVEVKQDQPPTSFHVLDQSGDWILSTDVNFSDLRKELYLKAWPVDKQLEAYHDSVNGNQDKLNEMNKDFAEIKNMYPDK